MKPIKSDVVEEICPACNGTGFLPVIKQPAPGKRIYPPRCTKCGGKGKLERACELSDSQFVIGRREGIAVFWASRASP